MTLQKFTRGTAAFGALLLAGTALPVSAATLLFDFSGDDGRSFTFTLDDTRAPDQTNNFGTASRIVFRDVAGTFVDPQGMDTNALSISFGTGFLSTLQVSTINFSPNTFRGPALFDGSTTNPQFNLGSFQLTGGALNGAGGTLNISQVAPIPEPATWAMMLLGFFGIGGVLRTRKSKVTSSRLSYS